MKNRTAIITLCIGTILILSLAYADRYYNILQPSGNIEQCGLVMTASNNSEQFQWEKTRWIVRMMFGVKSYVVNDFVVEWDTICKDWTNRVKKDVFISY